MKKENGDVPWILGHLTCEGSVVATRDIISVCPVWYLTFVVHLCNYLYHCHSEMKCARSVPHGGNGEGPSLFQGGDSERDSEKSILEVAKG